MCLAHGNSSEANPQRLGLGLTPGFLPLSHSLFFVSKWQIPVRYEAIRRYPDARDDLQIYRGFRFLWLNWWRWTSVVIREKYPVIVFLDCCFKLSSNYYHGRCQRGALCFGLPVSSPGFRLPCTVQWKFYKFLFPIIRLQQRRSVEIHGKCFV